MISSFRWIVRAAALAFLLIASAPTPGAAEGLWISGDELVPMLSAPSRYPPASDEDVRARDEAHLRAYTPLAETYSRMQRANRSPKMPLRWDSDVLLSAGDSLASNVELDFDVVTGTYYAYLWHKGYSGWEGHRLLYSTDEGVTWRGRSFCYYQSVSFNDADFVLCDSVFVCVGAGMVGETHYIIPAICHVGDAAWEHPPVIYSSEIDPVHSIALATDYDNYPTVPYVYLVAHAGDRILVWRSTDYGRTWIDETVLNSGNVRYPDVAYGWNTGGKLFVVYGKDQEIQLDRNSLFGSAGSWTVDFASWGLSDPGNMPVVAGIADTIQVAFERLNTGSIYRHVEVRASTNAGASWYGAIVSGGATEYMLPDITGRGGAFLLTFWECTDTERRIIFRRCLDTPSCWWTWTGPINDHFPYWDQKPYGNPCVEYLPGNRAGIVYTGFHENRRAWVDYEDSPVAAVDPAVTERGPVRIGPLSNPVRTTTPIPVALAEPAYVRLDLHDVEGRLVSRIFEGPLETGIHGLMWPSASIPAGTYFLRLTSGDAAEVRKVTLVKGD